MTKATVPFLILLFFLSACATNRVNPLLSQNLDTKIDDATLSLLTENSKLFWQGRDKKENLVAFLESNEKIAHSESSSQAILVLMARGHYLLGEYFTEGPDEQIKQWEVASNWAEKALTFNDNFKEKRIKQKLPTDQILDVLSKKDSEALYWFAAALGRWSSSQGISSVLKYKDRIKKMIDRVAVLNPNYFYGAVYRYYGVYYALLPEFNEEDLKNSRKNFEKALKKSPDYFSNHFLYAEYYAKKIDDQVLFKKQLHAVLQGNPHHLEAVYPEQILEQRRARILLEGK